jgi:iron complex outermembrane receptor protein
MDKLRLSLLVGAACCFDAAAVMAQSAAVEAAEVPDAAPPAEAAAPVNTDAETPAAKPLQIEEIVVTARKREESLQRVPVAVAVIGEAQLQNGNAHDLTKIGELAPQVSLSQGGSGTGAIITVRGVSSASNDAGLDQSVALEIDGVPISRGQIMSASLFDVAQIQVLQGPQALFFGKNSPAGVISIRSLDPTSSFEAYVTPGYEFEADERFLEAAVSGPLTDTLKARAAFRGSQYDGWIRNVAEPVADIVNPEITDPGATMGKHFPENSTYAGRFSLMWTPSADFDASLKLTLNSQERNAGNSGTEPFCINGQTQPVLLGSVPIPGGDCDKNRVTSHGSVAPEYAVNFPYANGGVPYFDSDFKLASLRLNQRLDTFTLTSTTGYYDQTVQQMSVSDWSPYATIWATSKESYELLTQELRLDSEFDGPVNFMVGAYYEHFDRPYFNAPDLFHKFNEETQNYAIAEMQSESRGGYYSGFAQLHWNIRDNLELAGGARYSHDEKRIRIENVETNPANPSLYEKGKVLRSKFNDDNVSPELTLSWYPAQDQTLYAAYKTGYKAGGLSNQFLVLNTATPDNIRFKPEEARGFELGYKATVFDRRLRFDLVAYRYNYEDLQVVSYNAETISFTIGNAASARIEGLQGSFDWLALDDVTVRGNIGYNRARYKSFPDAQCYPGQTAEQGCTGGVQDLAGKTLLRAPRLTYSLGADYEPHLLPEWSTKLSAQASYSSSYQAATDYAPGGLQKSYWLLNAAVRVGPDSGRYELALIGRNLTDSYYMLNVNGWSGSSNPNQYVGFFNRPREVVLQATMRF